MPHAADVDLITSMLGAQAVTIAQNLTELQAAAGTATGLKLLMGKTTLADGLGGFYYWDAANTDAADTTFLNLVAVAGVATGRWKRINQKVTSIAGLGVVVANNGVKTLYASASVVGTTGQATIYATSDGTATGAALFTEIWENSPSVKPPAAQANVEDNIAVAPQTESTDLKTLVYVATRGNKTTLGSTLTALLGLVITSQRYAPAGTLLRLTVTGI